MTDKPPPKPKNLIFHQDFLWFLGSFFGCWASIELLIAYGIGKFLRTSFEETHILTSGIGVWPQGDLTAKSCLPK